MSYDLILVIALLAIGTISLRVSGAWLGARLSRFAPLKHAIDVSSGCLIVALVIANLAGAPATWWAAAGISALVAGLSRNLIVTLLAGLASLALFERILIAV